MGITFNKTVAKQKLNDDAKQVVQTVDHPRKVHFDDKLAKAKAFLKERGIEDVKPVLPGLPTDE